MWLDMITEELTDMKHLPDSKLRKHTSMLACAPLYVLEITHSTHCTH